MLETETMELERLEDFVTGFQDDFRRRDQVRWAGVYLQGLLIAGARKNVGAMARQIVLPANLVVDDIGQAMQNFVNQSPWDEHKVWRRHRALMHRLFADSDGAFVLEEMAFIKQGRHSVGVQRQYCASLNCKTNCQIAVGLHYRGRAGICPLSLRLYLPRAWLTSLPRLEAACVPTENRDAQTRASIAIKLLDEAITEGWKGREVIAGSSVAGDLDFRQALAQRGLTLGEPNATPRVTESLRQLRTDLVDELGLDHFEGRSWRGFHHHACLVMLAFGYRALERAGEPSRTNAADDIFNV